MNKPKVVFLGTPSYVDPIIEKLEANFDLIKTIRSTDVDLSVLKDLNPDVIIVASFGKIIPQSVLDIPKLGTINIHPSALPEYRGPSPIQYQLLDGISQSAITFILMDAEMDHGPILRQIPFEIKSNETFESLVIKMFGESANYISEVINNLIEDTSTPVQQNHDEATFTKMIKKDSGYFEIDNPPDKEKFEKMIRAYHPWPGVWTIWRQSQGESVKGKEKIIKFIPQSVIARPQSDEAISKNNFLIQMEGKKATTIKDFLNGYSNFPLRDYLNSN